MKMIFTNAIRAIIAIPLIIIMTIILHFRSDLSFLVTIIISVMTITIIYSLIYLIMNFYFIKKHNLTIKQYLFIRRNLRIANKKLRRFYKTLFSFHHIRSLKQRIHLFKLMRKIFKLTNKEPQRFFQAEMFFYSHLDSVVELLEKFVFLSSQPNKDEKLLLALNETERTLANLTETIEDDLAKIIADDIEDLHFEIDVANYRYNRKTNFTMKEGDFNGKRQAKSIRKGTSK